MRKTLITAIIIISLIYVFFIPLEPVGFKVFIKLIPMALIIVLGITTSTLLPFTYKRTILFGLFICMIADGVIYWFLAGLITFFIGHIFYIFAYRQIMRKPMPIWVGFLLIVYSAVMVIWVAGSQFTQGNYVLAFAILAYILIILMMGWTAIRTRLPLAIIGAVLFIFSDSVLAIDRFVYEIPFRDGFVMLTYYSAQLLIALSIGSRLVKYSENRIKVIR